MFYPNWPIIIFLNDLKGIHEHQRKFVVFEHAFYLCIIRLPIWIFHANLKSISLIFFQKQLVWFKLWLRLLLLIRYIILRQAVLQNIYKLLSLEEWMNISDQGSLYYFRNIITLAIIWYFPIFIVFLLFSHLPKRF
jgi:hypothetical protein